MAIQGFTGVPSDAELLASVSDAALRALAARVHRTYRREHGASPALASIRAEFIRRRQASHA